MSLSVAVDRLAELLSFALNWIAFFRKVIQSKLLPETDGNLLDLTSNNLSDQATCFVNLSIPSLALQLAFFSMCSLK